MGMRDNQMGILSGDPLKRQYPDTTELKKLVVETERVL
jgi:hypothetical protein